MLLGSLLPRPVNFGSRICSHALGPRSQSLALSDPLLTFTSSSVAFRLPENLSITQAWKQAEEKRREVAMVFPGSRQTEYLPVNLDQVLAAIKEGRMQPWR